MNPEYVHVLRDDAASDEFVATRFPGRVSAAYNRLPCEFKKTGFGQPIDLWWPTDGAPVEFVTGLEWDTEPGTVKLQGDGEAPFHPIWRALVDRIVSRIETASVADPVDRVLELTDPFPWTVEIAQY
ncbi:hypothetical protein DFJ73DRAFT_765355 [Zopfochytrium polystomum]|nr:hypothetical protein DFJ73DRAFT_765355 [Zopfochytrium polystomum]